MAVKIRLARKGRKKKAFYHVVVADSRAPRDGRFIEKLGVYNPTTDPATIEINFDKALDWLQKGAQPTETCRAILSYKGILIKKHLLEGVKKGAFDEAEAEKRFQLWQNEKDSKIEAKIAGLEKANEDDKNTRLEAEKQINEARAAELAKKRSELAEAEAAAIAEKTKAKEEKVETPVEEKVEEVKAEAPAEKKVEEVKAEAPAEKKAEEVKAEAPAEKKAEEVKAEAPVEKKAEEVKAEAPAEKKAEEKNEEGKAKE